MNRSSCLLTLVALLCFGNLAHAQDDCSSPTVVASQLSDYPFTLNVNWAAATPSTGLSCGMGTGFPVPPQNQILDLWFAVVAPTDGNLVVDYSYNPAGHAVYLQTTPGSCPLPADIIYCDSGNQNGSTTPVTGGFTYLIRFGDDFPPPQLIPITVDFVPTVGNDDCSTPEVVPTIPMTVPFDLFGATPTTPTLTAAPCITTTSLSRDIWYEVTPAQTGMLGIEMTDPVNVMVYDSPGPGICPSPTDLVDIVDFIPGSGVDFDNACNTGSRFKLPVVAGNTYRIRLGTTGTGAAGDMSLRFALPPVNDNCDSPTPLTIGATIPIDTLGATNAANATHQSQFLDDLWFTIVAPADGRLHVQAPNCSGQVFLSPGPGLCPDDFALLEPPLTVNPPQPLFAGSFVDANNCLFPVVCYGGRLVTVTAGETYLLRLGGDRFAGGATVSTLTVDYYAHPPNDECATAELVSIVPAFTTNVNTYGALPPACSQPAQFTPGCPENCGQTVHGDVWYRFTPPASGILAIDFDEAAHVILYDTSLSLGCPTSADGKICVGIGTHLEEPVTGGVEYYLRVFWQNSSPGLDTDMTLSMLGFVPNDDCTSPTVVTLPTTGPVLWDNTDATDDTNGLSCTGIKDLWYSFIAPASGQCEMIIPDEGPRISAYHAPGGACPTDADELECVSCISQFGAICTPWTFDFSVVAGETYMVRISGLSQIPASGSFELDYTDGPPANVICDTSVAGQVTASYAVSPGSNYDLGVDVIVNGNMVANIPQTQLSYVHPLPPAFVGTVEIGFAGINSTTGTTQTSTCQAALGGPANDLCADALLVAVGSTPFDNTITTLDPSAPLSSCAYGTVGNDLWFEFFAPTTEFYTASFCSVQWDPIVEIWDGALGCPVPGDTPLDCNANAFECDASFFATQGNTYYIRVMGRNGAFGPGTLDLVPDCPSLTGLSASYDCATATVQLTWDAGAHDDYDVGNDTLGIVSQNQLTNTFTFPNEAPGLRTYTVTGNCPNGSSLSSSITVYVADLVDPKPDLILALAGLRDGGITGNNDSADAIAVALLQNGRLSTTLAIEDFDTFPCLSTLTDAAEHIWVVLGTNPFDYSLSTAEGDILGSLAAAGVGIYLEGADHWSGFHFPSLLDDRDGVEPNIFGNIQDGDASFTQMNGQDSGLTNGDFSSYAAIGYTQDSFTGDRTDRLVLTGTNDPLSYPPDPNISAGVIWTNSSDTTPAEDPYITGVHAIHDLDGGVMISASWELGGFGGDAGSMLLGYLIAFEVGPTEPMFRRGDTNADGGVNIADAIFLLGNLFPSGGPPNILVCLDAADGNNDGGVNIADAISILNSLFGAPVTPLPAPSMGCGTPSDAPVDTGIGCAEDTCP